MWSCQGGPVCSHNPVFMMAVQEHACCMANNSLCTNTAQGQMAPTQRARRRPVPLAAVWFAVLTAACEWTCSTCQSAPPLFVPQASPAAAGDLLTVSLASERSPSDLVLPGGLIPVTTLGMVAAAALGKCQGWKLTTATEPPSMHMPGAALPLLALAVL